MARDIPLDRAGFGLPHVPRDPDKVVELATRWGLESPATRLTQALGR